MDATVLAVKHFTSFPVSTEADAAVTLYGVIITHIGTVEESSNYTSGKVGSSVSGAFYKHIKII